MSIFNDTLFYECEYMSVNNRKLQPTVNQVSSLRNTEEDKIDMDTSVLEK
jgi:hypothetical protein